MDSPSGPAGYSERDELAKARNRAAADRTLMAWVRTSLALIGFGFGIERIVEALLVGKQGYVPTGLTVFVTLSFIALGIYGLISALGDYRQEVQSLVEGRYEFRARTPHSLILATILAVIGTVAFFGVLVQLLTQK